MRASLVAIVLFALCLSALLRAADGPAFETASVKRAERCAMQNTFDPGRIALVGDPLNVVLAEAYQVKADQVLGPSWLESDCFDITATMPAGSTRDQLPAMLQTLLADRFRLVAHKETRPRPGYALTVEKGGVKFKEAVPSAPRARSRSGQLTFGATRQVGAIQGAMTMTSLARFLSLRLGAPVEDLTALKGTYDIDVSWTPDPSVEKLGRFAEAGPPMASDAASLPSDRGNLFAALRDSLGLKLESRKQQVDVVVIDRVERTPTEN